MYGQVSSGMEQEFDYGIKNNSTQTVTTPTYLGTVGADGTYGKILLEDLQGKKAFLSTGLIKNGLISANGDPTKFNITAGIGIISNFDDPENPTSTIINFPAFTGITPTYLLTGTITYVAINNTASVVMQATPFTPEQRRSLIVLGAVIHSNLTTINVINNISAPTNASTNQLHDFIEAVGALNLTGNKYTANGANLQLNKSAGLIFKLGSNFVNDWKNPHELAQTSGTSLTFRYRTQNGTEGSDRINLDPALYDLNNVLTSVPNNKFTIQTVTMFQSGVTRIQYGQNYYDDLSSAKNAIFLRNFVLEPNSKENGIIRAYIIMRNTTTSLQTVADADILEAQKFGGVASGGVTLNFANIVSALGYTPENVANKQNSLVVDGTGTKYPTVDAINSVLPTTYSNIVYVNATSPTAATIFDLNNPPITNDNALKLNVNNLYIGTDASTWVYITSPAGYVTKVVLATSNFNLVSDPNRDSGNNKSAPISRSGSISTGSDSSFNGVAIGKGSGNIGSNQKMGVNAIMSNTTGTGLLAIGAGSLRDNTTGSSNLAVGTDALRSNLGGSSNTALGGASLLANVSGNNNSSVGAQSMFANTGSDNAGFGFGALFGNTTGSRNTSIGKDAGKTISSGGNVTITNNSTFVGYDARPLGDNQTNQLVVAYSGIGLGSNTSVFGNSTTTFGRWWGRLLVGGSVNDGINDIQATGTVSSGTTTLGNSQPTSNNQLTRRDYITTNFAPLVSPTLTGNPTAPTPTLGDNDTSVATTAFVTATDAGNVKLAGSQTITGAKDFSANTSFKRIFASSGDTSYTLYIDNTSTGNGIEGRNFSGAGTFISAMPNNGTGIYMDATTGSSGVAYKANSATTATGDLFQYTKNGVLTAKVNQLGEFTMPKLTMTGTIELKAYTVSTLPTGVIGAMAYVTDALAPTYMATVVGGGAVVTPVFYNGTNWVAH